MATLYSKCDRSYPLLHPELVDTTILPCEPETTQACAAELREISPLSAKLLVQGLPNLPAHCVIQLKSLKFMQTLRIPAEIDWARPNPAGDWLVECGFDAPMAEASFNELLAIGLLERRSSVRHQTRIPVEVQSAPGLHRLPGIIRDVSEGGLCLMTSEAPKTTRDVYISTLIGHDEVTLKLKVRWSLCVGPNHLIGCQFVDGQDYHLLRKMQPAYQEGLTEHSRASKPAGDRPRL